MDWAKIELEVQSRAASIIQNKSRTDITYRDSSFNTSKRFTSFDDPLQHNAKMFRSSPDFENDVTGESDVTSIHSNELNSVKIQLSQQNKKMAAVERILRGLTEFNEQSHSKNNDYEERLNQFEHDMHKILKYSNRDNNKSDLSVQTKTINLRLQQLEDSQRQYEENFVTKTAFTQLLDTCVEQLQTVGSAAESARASSSLFSTFAESLLLSLWDLRGSQPGFRLEFLSGLTLDGQREQLTRLLREALNQAVKGPVSTQLDAAAVSLRDALEGSRSQLSKDLDEIQSRYALQFASMEGRVDRVAEWSTQIESMIRSQRLFSRDMESLQEKLSEIEEQRRDFKDVTSRLQSSQSRLSETLSHMKSDIELQVSKSSENVQQLNRLQVAVNENASSNDELQQKLQRYKTVLQKHDSQQAEFKIVMNELSSQFADQVKSNHRFQDFSKSLTRLQTSHAELGEVLSGLAQGQLRLQLGQQEIQKDINGHKDQIQIILEKASEHEGTKSPPAPPPVTPPPPPAPMSYPGNDSSLRKGNVTEIHSDLTKVQRDVEEIALKIKDIQNEMRLLSEIVYTQRANEDAHSSIVSDLEADIVQIQQKGCPLSRTLEYQLKSILKVLQQNNIIKSALSSPAASPEKNISLSHPTITTSNSYESTIIALSESLVKSYSNNSLLSKDNTDNKNKDFNLNKGKDINLNNSSSSSIKNSNTNNSITNDINSNNISKINSNDKKSINNTNDGDQEKPKTSIEGTNTKYISKEEEQPKQQQAQTQPSVCSMPVESVRSTVSYSISNSPLISTASATTATPATTATTSAAATTTANILPTTTTIGKPVDSYTISAAPNTAAATTTERNMSTEKHGVPPTLGPDSLPPTTINPKAIKNETKEITANVKSDTATIDNNPTNANTVSSLATGNRNIASSTSSAAATLTVDDPQDDDNSFIESSNEEEVEEHGGRHTGSSSNSGSSRDLEEEEEEEEVGSGPTTTFQQDYLGNFISTESSSSNNKYSSKNSNSSGSSAVNSAIKSLKKNNQYPEEGVISNAYLKQPNSISSRKDEEEQWSDEEEEEDNIEVGQEMEEGGEEEEEDEGEQEGDLSDGGHDSVAKESESKLLPRRKDCEFSDDDDEEEEGNQDNDNNEDEEENSPIGKYEYDLEKLKKISVAPSTTTSKHFPYSSVAAASKPALLRQQSLNRPPTSPFPSGHPPVSATGTTAAAAAYSLKPATIRSGSLASGRAGMGPLISSVSSSAILQGRQEDSDYESARKRTSSASAYTAAAAARTAGANRPSPASSSLSPARVREETSQCVFCLKRIQKADAAEHHRTCSLRMELCSAGCGSRVLAIKMDKHLEICPRVTRDDSMQD